MAFVLAKANRFGLLLRRGFKTTPTILQDDPQILSKETALATRDQLEEEEKRKGRVDITPCPEEVSLFNGIPRRLLKERTARIYQATKNCMQSGTSNTGNWVLEFDTRQRWENPLMGWCSSGDPLSCLKLQFPSREEAIVYCERNGWFWCTEREPAKRRFKPKSYNEIYSWNRKTRASTK